MTASLEESVSQSLILSHKPVRSWTGYVFGLLAAMSSSTGSLFFKITDENKMIVVLVRNVLQFLLLVPVMSFKKVDLSGKTWKTNLLIFLRGILSPSAMIAFGFALNYLTLGDANAIAYTYPALAGFFACICLKEKCGIFNVVLTIVTVIGFVLVAQPSFIFGGLEDAVHASQFRIVGVLFAVGAAACTAVEAVIVRKLGTGVHFMTSMLYACWEGATFVVLFLTISGESLLSCIHSLPTMLGCGCGYLLSQAFGTLALQREKAGSIALIQSSQVIFSFTLEYIFLGVVPNFLCVIGAGLILLSCVALTTKNILKTLRLEKQH